MLRRKGEEKRQRGGEIIIKRIEKNKNIIIKENNKRK